MKNKKLWFKAKNYGWGWYPATREGWFVMAWYIASLVLILRNIDESSASAINTLFGIVLPSFLVTAILLVICYKTG